MTQNTTQMPASAKRMQITAVVVTGLLALLSLPSVLQWQKNHEQQTLSLSHLHRLAYSLQLYAQDYDDALPEPIAPSSCLDWTTRLRGYYDNRQELQNPSNPFQRPIKDHATGCPIHSGYALNQRFYGQFSPGPFPFYNLVLPAQTALLVEAGPMWKTTGRAEQNSASPQPWGSFAYTDTLQRFNGLVPFPSTHNHKLCLAAADGHAVCVRVAHYSPADGPHNTMLGRIGSHMYNWNGGRPNGHADQPPQE